MNKQKGCINCEYSFHYFKNGLKGCPNAFSDVAKNCNLYDSEELEDGSIRSKITYKE